MPTNPDHGLAGALGEAIGAREGAAENEQLNLIADMPLLGEIKDDSGAPIQRGPGRPKGSRNKRTEDIAKYILSNYRDPLIGLADIVSTPIPELKKQLKCKHIEAADFWRKCAADLSRYVHQAMPQSVKLEGANAGRILVIDMSPDGAGVSGEGLPLTPIVEIEQNQALSDSENPKSHADQSHEVDK